MLIAASMTLGSALRVTPVGSRRAFLATGATAALTTALPASANVKACKKGANNCYSSTSAGKNAVPAWSFPAGEASETALSTLAEVVDSYPQAGQKDADKGGWTVVEGSLKSGNARLEFKSGIGNFAKFFNNNKPFVDDLEFAFDGVQPGVAVFSSSRVGDSDFGVNKKRLDFISAKLREKGWDAPDVVALQ